jgi:hypothetical protein
MQTEEKRSGRLQQHAGEPLSCSYATRLLRGLFLVDYGFFPFHNYFHAFLNWSFTPKGNVHY